MLNPNENPRQIIASVTSGLCNRLWVLACALRLADQCDRRVALQWLQRTGRVGLPYEGEEKSSLEDFCLPDIEGLASVTPLTSAPEFKVGSVGLDYSDIHELTLARQAGRPLEITPELVAKATAPRILDVHDPQVAAASDVWINLSTMPVGGPDDGMERFIVYPDQLGKNSKDAFLSSLSVYARRIQLRPAEKEIAAQLIAKMRSAPGGARLAGIHVRATDLKQRSAVDRNAQLAAIIHHHTCVPGEQAARIFLTSDSETWLEDFIRTAVRPQARTAITTYVNPIKYENSVAGSRAAMIDLYTLAACDIIYGTAGSSFSSYAWLLSDAQFWIHS